MRSKNNPHGYCSPEFWDYETKMAKQEGLTLQEKLEKQKSQAHRCPICGTPDGFSMGTGDCGCARDRE